MAKSLGGGLPISGVTGRAEVMDSVHPLGLGTTYGGNPVARAAALAVLDAFEEDDLLSIQGKHHRGARYGELREKHPFVGDVRGRWPPWSS